MECKKLDVSLVACRCGTLYLRQNDPMKKPNVQEHAANRCPVLVVTLEQDLAGLDKFVEIRLRQFRLYGRYTSNDIINECVVRLGVAVSQGKAIPCPAGWLRVTALNHIQELYRQEKKTTSYDPVVLSALPLGVEADSDPESQYRLLYESLCALPVDQRELLELRFLQQLSWNIIAERFLERGEFVRSTALRKRGERALMALRRIYLTRVRGQE